MKFSELMKNLEHEDLEFITKYGEIKEYQDEYFYTINSQTSDLMQEIKSKVSEKKPMFPYLSDNKSLSDIDKPIKWDVLLSNKCETRSAKELIGKFYRGNRDPKSPFLDKGHLVAREFQKYICGQNESIDNFFYKNVSSNIAYQFCDKNRGNGKKRGQHQFEQAVMNCFQKAKDKDSESKKVIVYYEVEPIFRKSGDKIPIGTRIFAFRETDTSDQVNNFISQSKKKDEFKITLPYHVFIPNYMECKGVEKDSETTNAFKEFYAGNKEVRATISKWYPDI
ncbi:hypothetical protein ACRPK1_07465 [Lactobacillus johnsonii]|uniref:hypothetical protein n=1 Tax=Lactobacillus johnsonii TaxID=33959 RepID=UPI003D76BF90